MTITDPLRPTAVISKYISKGGYIRQLLDRDEIPNATAAIALRTSVDVAEHLGLPPVITVYFYRPCAAGHPDAMGPLAPIPNGLCMLSSTEEIWIRADLTPSQTERTVAHELRHLWQNLQGLGAFSSKADRERDARQFDQQWMARNS